MCAIQLQYNHSFFGFLFIFEAKFETFQTSFSKNISESLFTANIQALS